MSDDDETERFHALWDWLRAIGCQGLCALRLAITAVEHEGGRNAGLVAQCGHKPKCDEVARRRWEERPRKVIEF